MMVSPSHCLGDKTGSVKFFDPQRGFGHLAAVTPGVNEHRCRKPMRKSQEPDLHSWANSTSTWG